MNTSDGGTSVDTENLGGGTYWPLAVDSMLSLANEEADVPVTISVGEMALAALVIVPVVGVVGWFLWSNAPVLYAVLKQWSST
jgi:hypothetical protein